MEYELRQESRIGEPKATLAPSNHDAAAAPEERWNPGQRIGFRLLFSYLSLYLIHSHLIEGGLGLLNAVGLAPGAAILLWPYARIWAPLVTWTGVHILHVKSHLAYAPEGNSDGIFGYVQVFTFAALAVIATLVWTLADRRNNQYSRLNEGLRILLRYALAFSMLTYGMIKVIPVQFFGLPNLISMAQRFGELSSFSLLWSFMGYSHAYTIFAGAVEVVAGLLLFFRQTTMLGALLCVASLVNVGVLDFAYGVPEKLDVIHLVVFSAVLLSPDLSRLARFLVFNQPTTPANLGAAPSAKWMRNARISVKASVMVYMLAICTLLPFKLRKLYDPPSPLYGIYEVEQFERNGKVLPPLATDTIRWKKIVFETRSETWIETMDDSWHFDTTEYDLNAKTATLLNEGTDHKSRNVLAYSQPDSGSLVLRGESAADSCSITLKKFDESKFPLMRSHFRWINGFP